MGYNIISRQQRKLTERGLSEDQARWIAYKKQRDSGNTNGNSFQLSDNGKRYSDLTPLEREIVRRSRRSGKPTSAYTIKNGRVILKK